MAHTKETFQALLDDINGIGPHEEGGVIKLRDLSRSAICQLLEHAIEAAPSQAQEELIEQLNLFLDAMVETFADPFFEGTGIQQTARDIAERRGMDEWVARIDRGRADTTHRSGMRSYSWTREE